MEAQPLLEARLRFMESGGERGLNLVCEAPMAPPCSPGCISGCISVFMLDHYPHCLTLTHSAFSLSSSSFLMPIGAMSAGSGVQAVGVAGRERV